MKHNNRVANVRFHLAKGLRKSSKKQTIETRGWGRRVVFLDRHGIVMASVFAHRRQLFFFY